MALRMLTYSLNGAKYNSHKLNYHNHVMGLFFPLRLFLCAGHEDCLEVVLELKPCSIQEGNPFTPLHCAL